MLNQILAASSYYFNPHAVPVFFVSTLILFIGFFVLKQDPFANVFLSPDLKVPSKSSLQMLSNQYG